MKRRNLHLFTAALVAVLAAACTPGGGSIYFTLENEVKVEDGSLPNAITVFDVAKVGTDYYAAGGTIWSAPVAADSFQLADVVDPPTGAQLCTALAEFSGQLYGGFINSSGNLGLYVTPVPAFAWSAVADVVVAGAQVVLLKVVDSASTLVVVTARQPTAGADFQFGVVTSIDGTNYSSPFTFTDRPAGDEEKMIGDVIYSSRLSTWFVTQGTKLYSGAPGALAMDDMTNISAGEELRGLFDDGTNLYVASKAGAIYYSTTGDTWTRIEVPDISGTHPPLTGISGPLGGTHLLIGSDGYGYYRLDTTNLAAGPDAFTRFATNTVDLYKASVRRIVVDGTTAFALTSMGGLWRGTVSGNDIIDWKQE
jgi:hypothetical protein